MSHFMQETRALTRRWVLRQKREMGSLILGLIQPLMWMLLFGNMFGQVAGWRPQAFGTDRYLDFQCAGMIAFTILGNAMMGAVPLLFDRENGFLDKLLATPMSRAALLISRFAYVVAFSLAQSVLILAVALAMGVTIQGGVKGVILIFMAGALLCFGFTLVSIALVFILPGHAAFFAATTFLMTPILFLSDALMPLAAMPPALQWLALANPLTHAIALMRPAVIGGFEMGRAIGAVGALLVFDVLMLVFAIRMVKRKIG
jgi:ABC-2 type transport system permease protein